MDVHKKIAIRTEKHTDKIHRSSVDHVCTHDKEGLYYLKQAKRGFAAEAVFVLFGGESGM